jgi:hypothetical protein
VYIELLVHCLLRYMLLLFDILYVTLLRLLFLFLFFGGRRGGGGRDGILNFEYCTL